jgi:hypothetical protein
MRSSSGILKPNASLSVRVQVHCAIPFHYDKSTALVDQMCCIPKSVSLDTVGNPKE